LPQSSDIAQRQRSTALIDGFISPASECLFDEVLRERISELEPLFVRRVASRAPISGPTSIGLRKQPLVPELTRTDDIKLNQ